MGWDVEFTDEFGCWWAELDEPVQDGIDRAVHLLEARGPTLPFPHSSDVRGSYERMIPIADRIHDEHLEELEKEQRRSSDSEEK